MLKIAAAVIVYNPDETVPKNISTYASYFDKIYIKDNSEKPHVFRDLLAAIPGAVIDSDMHNEGVAIRLNEACKKAAEEGFQWLMTMDQDSFFDQKAIQGYLEAFMEFRGKDMVAQFGIINKEESYPATAAFTKKAQEVDMMITSGSLVNLDIWKTIGGFDPAYFIDQVDNDYCVRAKLAGFRLVSFPEIFLVHRIGEKVKRSSVKSLFLLKKYKTVHSPLRCYYIKRNLLYFENKFAAYDLPVVKQIAGYTNRYLKQNLYYNGAYWKTLAYIRKAKKDFKNGIMGKINNTA